MQILFGIGLPLTLLMVGRKISVEASVIPGRLLVAALQYISFHSIKVQTI